MSKLTDERKRQIRAEEEARARAEAEEKYRAEVRTELAGGPGPVTTVKGHAPGPKRPPAEPARSPTLIVAKPGRRGALLVALGAVLVVAGIVLTVLGSGGTPVEPEEKTAAGGGALAAVTPAWKPSDLGYDELDLRGGTVKTIPDPGTTTLADLRAQAKAGPHGGLDPDEPAGPTTPPATTGALDALLVHVPPEAFTVVAFDLDRTRGSAALMAMLDTLLRQTGLAGRVGPLAGVGAIAIAGVPSAPGKDPWPIVVLKLPSGDLRVVAAPEIEARAMAAPTAGNVLGPGALSDALASVRSGPAGFGAIRMMDEARGELARMLPGLEKIQWLAGTLDTSSGIALAGSAVFPDDTSAASVAMAISIGKSLAKSQLPAAAAVAVDKLAFTAMGNAVKISARWTEADVAGLLAATR